MIENNSMSMGPGLLILLIFAVFAALMMSRRMPALLALPCMAFSIAIVSGLAFDWSTVPQGVEPSSLSGFLEKTVLTDGASRLAGAMMFAVFGAILSQLVMRCGIAQRIVSVAAEYAGDRKMLLAGLLTLVVAVCFASVTGLGAVIMLGSLALPILLGAGLSASYSACLLLFAIALGGVFNPAILGFYVDTLKLELQVVRRYVATYGGLLAATTVVFFLVEGRKETGSYAWAALEGASATPKVPLPALLTPVLPIALIMFFSWEIIPAFLVGIVYGALASDPARALSNITASTLEGLKDISPVIGLFIGIGMALNAMMAEPTKQVMKPFLEVVLPTSPIGFLVFFTLLAPLALYRGPLNFFGLGAGVAGLILGADLMPALAVMAAFLAVGQIEGVCDPTNTHNVWLATFTKCSTEQFLKRTLPYVWGFVAVALAYSALGMQVMQR